MIDGVLAHTEEIDTILNPFCTKRKLELMDKVDRAILRLAIWELNYNSEDVSPSIVINEAVQLAKSFGSDASYKLINAILDAYNKRNNETILSRNRHKLLYDELCHH